MSIDTVTSHTLDVPGASLHYDVRGSGPLLMMIGAPMDGSGFAGLAPLFARDHTVVTYDPRGISRSALDGPPVEDTPHTRAADVLALITALGAGPAVVFGSSGGAMTGLALAARHPEQVHTLVAHEAPLVRLLPDRAPILTVIDAIRAAERRDGPDAGMAMFFALGSIVGEVRSDDPRLRVGPDALPFAMPPEAQPGNRYFLRHMLPSTGEYLPDIAALQAATTRIVVACGTTSTGQIAQRGAAALAEQLGTGLVRFPGDHGGFMHEPEPFARTLREVLSPGA